MARRGHTAELAPAQAEPKLNTYLSPRHRSENAPWQSGYTMREQRLYTTVRQIDGDFPHVFSVCLYEEPCYASRFPTRDYRARYIDRMPQIRRHLSDLGWGLHLWTSPDLLDRVMSMPLNASVHVVHDRPTFPFSQHLWRYYTALLSPQDRGSRNVHFRGLDNLLVGAREIALLNRFAEDGGEVLHAPFVRSYNRRFMQVRGSCSIAGAGLDALAWYLRTQGQPMHSEPDDWRSDEIYLDRWFGASVHWLRTCTVIDRPMPPAFYHWLSARIAQRLPGEVIAW